MRVVVADVAGMCFGVRDALRTVAALPNPERVTIHGHLVHNEVVLTQLGVRGFRLSSPPVSYPLPSTPDVLITAHGISDAERARLIDAGKNLLDTTCPLVARVHRAARQLEQDGFFVVVIGRPDHVEVRGIVGDLRAFAIVERADTIPVYPAQRIGVVCQTTTPPRLADQIRAAIEARNPHAEIRFVDTICAPTRAHQQALDDLLPRVDCMIVVGGRASNNTRELVALCLERGIPAHHVVDASELRRDWFAGVETVGLTAGTSTLDETLAEVHARLESWAAQRPIHPSPPWNSREWCDFFERNRDDQLPLPWAEGARISRAELRTVGPSLQDFQLGESSEGNHFRRSARANAEAVGDPEYARAVDLFIREEGRHSQRLAQFLEQAGLPTLERSWTDAVFRLLRRDMPLEVVISILLCAEMIAMSYYRAVHDATRSELLRRLCAQLLRDERMHLRFHCERLAIIRRRRSRWRLAATHLAQGALLVGTCVVVWWKHGTAFRAGGFTVRRFCRVTWSEFRRLLAETRRAREGGNVEQRDADRSDRQVGKRSRNGGRGCPLGVG